MSEQDSQLDLEIIGRLNQTARSRGSAGEPEEDYVEYDWSVPSHFTRDQKAGLDDFAARLSPIIAEALSKQFKSEVQLEVASVTEHYAAQLRPVEEESSDFCVEFLDKGRSSCGFVAFLGEKAFAWVAKLLGGEVSAVDTDKEMSSLESAILLDIFSTLGEAVSQALNAANASPLSCGKELSRGPCGLGESDAEEYCKITLRDPEAQDQPGIYLVILSAFLEPIVAQLEAAGGGQGGSAEQTRKNMLKHLEHASVVAEAYLGTAFVKVRNLTDLQPGDVLLTERKVDDPMDVFVQGNKVFLAFPVTWQGEAEMKHEGRPILLRFQLRQAKLFAVEFY